MLRTAGRRAGAAQVLLHAAAWQDLHLPHLLVLHHLVSCRRAAAAGAVDQCEIVVGVLAPNLQVSGRNVRVGMQGGGGDRCWGALLLPAAHLCRSDCVLFGVLLIAAARLAVAAAPTAYAKEIARGGGIGEERCTGR